MPKIKNEYYLNLIKIGKDKWAIRGMRKLESHMREDRTGYHPTYARDVDIDIQKKLALKMGVKLLHPLMELSIKTDANFNLESVHEYTSKGLKLVKDKDALSIAKTVNLKKV